MFDELQSAGGHGFLRKPELRRGWRAARAKVRAVNPTPQRRIFRGCSPRQDARVARLGWCPNRQRLVRTAGRVSGFRRWNCLMQSIRTVEKFCLCPDFVRNRKILQKETKLTKDCCGLLLQGQLILGSTVVFGRPLRLFVTRRCRGGCRCGRCNRRRLCPRGLC